MDAGRPVKEESRVESQRVPAYIVGAFSDKTTEGFVMRNGCLLLSLAVGLLVGGAESARGQGSLPAMKFGDVREIAPGVFFRYSAISAVDKDVVFGGSNNIWVVFDDYVLVYDANFPKEAGDVIAAINT